MVKERIGLLAPAIRVLWETAEKTWQRSFSLFVAVKHCGTFIMKGNRFNTSKVITITFIICIAPFLYKFIQKRITTVINK